MIKQSFFILCVIGFSGCVKYYQPSVSTNALGEKEIPLAVTTGMSNATYFLGIGPNGDDTISSAILDALSPYEDASTLNNVFIERRAFGFPSVFFPIILQVKTMVTGTVVKYKDVEIKPIFTNFSDNISKGGNGKKIKSMLSLKRGDSIKIVLTSGKVEHGVFIKYSNYAVEIRPKTTSSSSEAKIYQTYEISTVEKQ